MDVITSFIFSVSDPGEYKLTFALSFFSFHHEHLARES